MKEEIEYRILTMRPKLIEEVKRTREFGDLSENFEYKEAKKNKNRNESRIRYLNNMIRTARIVEENPDDSSIGINDIVECYIPDMDEDYADIAQQMYEYTVGKYVNHIKIGGSKIILDGSPQGKSAWLSTPYENEKEYCGPCISQT